MDEIFCRYANLPSKINAVTVIDENGDYNVYVNVKLSTEAQKQAFRHEVKHIKKNHFFQNKPVKECEEEAK